MRTNWVLEPCKFLNKDEAGRLLNAAEHRAQVAKNAGNKTAIRDYFIVHLAMATGLRVMEIAALKCGDVFLDEKMCSILVRKGKGNKKRLVFFSGPFRQHCKEYFKWKQRIAESIGPEEPLIVSSNTGGHLTTRAIQKVFKRCAEKACLNSSYSIHSLRHTYACFLLKASDWNLRLVQKQLGHARISTTQVYADVMMPDVKKALDRLYI
ncbi:MAG TPA: tyrosine-type recombinase/integrase [Anaerohalosphaeraceae bacterium]|nr:tyrosine-type recombinase/integrase [Anaerohalosphaeraceae bacterium]